MKLKFFSKSRAVCQLCSISRLILSKPGKVMPLSFWIWWLTWRRSTRV